MLCLVFVSIATVAICVVLPKRKRAVSAEMKPYNNRFFEKIELPYFILSLFLFLSVFLPMLFPCNERSVDKLAAVVRGSTGS